jgi:hypothetical protein
MLHTFAEQQPVGQLVESHTQPLEVQCWPLPHCAPPLQVHIPLLQVFAAFALHATQEPPFGPQFCAVAGLTQVLPLQQPPGQLVALHTQLPFTHCWPVPQAAPPPQWHRPSAPQVSPPCAGQFTHAEPLSAQFDEFGGVTHEVPLQQPDAQLVALHWHTPLTHC